MLYFIIFRFQKFLFLLKFFIFHSFLICHFKSFQFFIVGIYVTTMAALCDAPLCIGVRIASVCKGVRTGVRKGVRKDVWPHGGTT